MNPFDKKLVSFRLQENVLADFDAVRGLTKMKNRTEMIEHAMRVYTLYILHQSQHGEDFE